MLLLHLSDRIAHYRYYAIAHRVPEAHADHRAIIAALRNHAAQRAEALAQAHVEVEQRLAFSKLRERLDDNDQAEPPAQA